MRFIGIHPRQWHRGAWIIALLLAALVLLLTHRPIVGRAFAMEPPAGDTQSSQPGGSTTAPMASDAGPAHSTQGNGYVAEIVDSSYTVGPAEFFALDLPMNLPGAKAVHLSGTVTTKGRKDIVVRLFRAGDYDRWLKQKSGRKPQAFWTSQRSKNLTLDQDLPPGEPVVLLLDNGFSIRTPKQVSCQLQLRYQRNGTESFDTEGGGISGSPAGTTTPAPEDNLPPPRSNTDQEMPPPPPPPPDGY